MKYITCTKRDETTDGLPCYIAWHPELVGCMAQGMTPQEAEANLTEARELVITHLVKNGLPIPEPMLIEHTAIDFRDMWR